MNASISVRLKLHTSLSMRLFNLYKSHGMNWTCCASKRIIYKYVYFANTNNLLEFRSRLLMHASARLHNNMHIVVSVFFDSFNRNMLTLLLIKRLQTSISVYVEFMAWLHGLTSQASQPLRCCALYAVISTKDQFCHFVIEHDEKRVVRD